MDNKRALEALVSDLKRMAVGLQRGSLAMAQRFGDEALKRRKEISDQTLEPYVVNLLNKTERTIRELHEDRAAEDALMESTLLQNFIQKKFYKRHSFTS